MIEVLFKLEKSKIVFFEIKGHSNLSNYGNDIVCASISSTSIMTLNGLLEHLKLNVNYKMEDAYISCDLYDIDSEGAQLMCNSLLSFIIEVSKQYPKNLKLKVMEV